MKIFQRSVLLIKVLVLLMVGASGAWASNAVSDHGAASVSKAPAQALYAADTKPDDSKDDSSGDDSSDEDDTQG